MRSFSWVRGGSGSVMLALAGVAACGAENDAVPTCSVNCETVGPAGGDGAVGLAGSSSTAGGQSAGGAGGSTSSPAGAPAAGGATAGASGASGGPPVFEECTGTSSLGVTRLDTTAIADMGLPFDPSEQDDTGPYDWDSNYGKAPEIVAVSSGSEFDILWQDHSSEAGDRGFVVHVAPAATPGQYEVTLAYQIELLGQVMGFARDEAGDYYYATGVDEDDAIDVDYPPEDAHRENIVRLVKFDVSGCVDFDVDVDMARDAFDSDAESIINPMVAASSRLAVGGGGLALVHGINTNPDDGGVRHQKALTTHFDALTGAITRTASMWVSHSFDQRLLWDGTGFVELHLGDAFPRALAFGRFFGETGSDTYQLYKPKGPSGENATYTRLGGLAPVEAGDYGYLVVFSSDRSAELPTGDWSTIEGTRDLALVRVRRDFASMDNSGTAFIDDISSQEQPVNSSGEAVTNRLVWLTDYTQEGPAVHAARGRIQALGGDQFAVLWERWEGEGNDSEFTGTWGTILSSSGAVGVPSARLFDAHILRGDDTYTVDGKAAYVTGNASARSLSVHLVGADLAPSVVTLP